MEYKALYGEFPFLKEVGRERQEQFAEYFKSAPLWLMKELQMEELKKGTVFIREGEPADTVFSCQRYCRSHGLPYLWNVL